MKFLLPLLVIAALAGCVSDQPDTEQMLPKDPNAGTSENNGFAPQGTQLENATDELSLVGVFDTCEEGYCMELAATNEGSQTWHVETGCSTPFRDEMHQEGKFVAHREPHFQCLGFGTTPFGAGESINQTFVWDGQVWDDETAAPGSGAYQWTGTFTAYSEPLGEEQQKLSVTFTVVLGAT
ncbi:MAG: hypothetical protein ACPHK8_01155 [Thermoplasmatota archaeon]